MFVFMLADEFSCERLISMGASERKRVRQRDASLAHRSVRLNWFSHILLPPSVLIPCWPLAPALNLGQILQRATWERERREERDERSGVERLKVGEKGKESWVQLGGGEATRCKKWERVTKVGPEERQKGARISGLRVAACRIWEESLAALVGTC